MNNNIEKGRIGELFAQSVLESYGIRTSHVDIMGDDLWAKTPADVFVKVQVKSSSRPILHSAHHTMKKYSFALHRMRKYDGAVLLVALDKQLLLARWGLEIVTKTIKITPASFTKQAQDESVAECFNL